MSATRTQIYLTESQRRRIDQIADTEGLPMAEVIRRALDQYLGDDIDANNALAQAFGADPTASVPSRHDWQRG